MVLRFPGLPDAIGGTIRGMQSYHRWLYFGEMVGGVPQGIHYDRLRTADYVRDYRNQIEHVLGREVQTQFSSKQVERLCFTPALAAPSGVPAGMGSIRNIFLNEGRVLFGGALAFESERQLRQMLEELQATYGIRPTLVAPGNAPVQAFTPELVRGWFSENPSLLPPGRRGAAPQQTETAAQAASLPSSPVVPFDLIVFDFDNTLAFTTPLKAFRGLAPAAGEEWNQGRRNTSAQRDVRAWIKALKSGADGPKLAVISKSPRWYLDALLDHCYPGTAWDAVLGHDEARAAGHRYKPDPTLLLELMGRFGVSPGRTLVIGDEDDDVEMAYRAGARALMVDFYSLETKRHLEEQFRQQQRSTPVQGATATRDWTFFNALETLPHAVCTVPQQLGEVAADLALHELPLEAALAGTPLTKLRREAKHFRINLFSRLRKGGRRLPTTILGRYFTAPKDEKGVHAVPGRDTHTLTRQILDKEHGEAEVPAVWVDVVAWILKGMARQHQNLVVTIIPAKLERPPRLENLLYRVGEVLKEDGCGLLLDPTVFHFTPGTPSNKLLNGEERGENLERNLLLHPTFRATPGHNYVVIDDVTTTGSTFLRARNLLESQGVAPEAVQALAIAKTVSFRDRSRP